MTPRGVLQNLLGVGEAGLALGSGYLSGAVSGIQGLGAGLGAQAGAIRMGHNPFDPNVWLDPATQAIQQGGTPVYEPRTEAGQEALSAVSIPFQLLERGADWDGGKTAEATNPELGATLYTILMGARKPGKPSTVWSSPLEKALSTTQAKGDAGHYISALKKEKGALAEAKMSGLLDVLESSPKHTREGLLNHPRMALSETVKGGLGTPAGQIREVNAAEATQLFNDNVPIHWWDKVANNAIAIENVPAITQSSYFVNRPQRYVIRTGGVDVDGTVDANYVNPSLYSETRYGRDDDLNLPGGTNAKEILVQYTEPLPTELPEGYSIKPLSGHPRGYKWTLEKPDGYGTSLSAQTYEEAYQDALTQIIHPNFTHTFRSSHFEEPNILVHIRANERDVGGKKALHIEEIQSDWHQRGQKRGYVDADRKRGLEGRISDIEKALAANTSRAGNSFENVMIWVHPEGGFNFADRNQNVANDYASIGRISREGNLSLTKYTTPEQKIILETHADLVKELHLNKDKLDAEISKIPDAPYKKNWYELGFKRAFAEAIKDPSIERLTWTTGEVQAERYDLSKHLSEVHLSGSNFVAYDHDGNTVIKQTGVRDEDLPEMIGKEAAEKLLAQPRQGTLQSLRGLDLRVGGEFHKQLYDEKITKFPKEWLKKFKVKPKRVRESLPLSGYKIEEFYGSFDVIHIESGEVIQSAIPSREQAHEWLLKHNHNPNVWYIDITPEMREYFFKHGIPLAEVDQLQQAYA